MKATVIIPEDSPSDLACMFTDDNDNVLFWDKMTKEMRSDIVKTLDLFSKFFASHINDD